MRDPSSKLTRWALGLLALMYGLAVLAPLLANDRPLWIVAHERGTQALAETSFPALADLPARELVALVCVPFALLAFLWWRRRRPLHAQIAIAAAILSCALLLALRQAHDERAPKEWKRRIGAGELVVEHALFAPIPFGCDETKLSEAWRPPTWLARADIDEQGRRVREAASSPRSGELVAPPVPVEVLPAEPARNAWRRHLLGTDGLGRDVFARLLWGARSSLSIGLVAALCAALLGTLVGAWAGWKRGRVDLLLSRGIEIVLCVPAILLVLLFAAVADPQSLPPGLALGLAIGCVSWTGVARLVRAEFLKLRELDYAQSARVLGYSDLRIVLRHLLPNALGPILVATSFAVGAAILFESAISFLGYGIREPIPSWGGLVREARSLEHWWIALFPGLCLALAGVAWNWFGERLRDALDPRAGGERRA